MSDPTTLLTATALALLDQAEKGDGTEAPPWVALMPDLVEAIDPQAEHLQRSGLCLLASLAFHGEGPVPEAEVERWMGRLMERGAQPFKHLNIGLNNDWHDHPCAFLVAVHHQMDGFCAQALVRCAPDPSLLAKVRHRHQGLVWQVAERGMLQTLAQLLHMGLPPEGPGCEGILSAVADPQVARMLMRAGASTQTPNREGRRPRETWQRLNPATRQSLEREVQEAGDAGEIPPAEVHALQSEALLQALLKADLAEVDRLWREGARDPRALAVAIKGACAPEAGYQHNLAAVLRLLKLDPKMAALEQPLLHLFAGLCGHFASNRRGVRCLEQATRLQAYVHGAPKPVVSVRALKRLLEETQGRGGREAFSRPLLSLLAHRGRNGAKAIWLQPLLNLSVAEFTGNSWYRYGENQDLTQFLSGMEPGVLSSLDPAGWTEQALIIAIFGAVHAGLYEGASETGRALIQCVSAALLHHPEVASHEPLLVFLNNRVLKESNHKSQIARSWLAVLARHTLDQKISPVDQPDRPVRPRM